MQNKTLIEHAEPLLAKALNCDRVHNEHDLKGSFIEAIQDSIYHSMHSFSGANKLATMQDLERHVTSLASPQNGLISGEGM